MNKSLSLIALAAALAFAAPAIAADKTTAEVKVKTEQNADGSYKQEVSKESKDAAGTKMTSENKTDVDVKSDGDVEKKNTTVETKDPKGLFNKEKTKTETKVEHKDGKTVEKHTKTVNGKTVEDTKSETPAVVDEHAAH